MKKITLNSYKRKIVVFGVLVFMSIGLISTGFAAWVMSTNPEQTQTGNVNVGLIEDANLTITLDEIPSNGLNIAFEALASDTTGRIRAKKEGAVENLSFTVSGYVTPLEYFNKLYYEFIIPEGVKNAADEGYIKLPEGASTKQGSMLIEIPREELTATTVNSQEVLAFEIVIEFQWGDLFGGQNPGVYYDEDVEGKKVSDADCKKTVENLRAMIYGYYDELNAPEVTDRDEIINEHVDDTLAFILYITATTN